MHFVLVWNLSLIPFRAILTVAWALVPRLIRGKAAQRQEVITISRKLGVITETSFVQVIHYRFYWFLGQHIGMHNFR